MKKCINCGADNKNENAFCSTCGGTSFEEPYSTDNAAPPPPPAPAPANFDGDRPAPPPPPYIAPPAPIKKPFGIFDVLTILGFVSSIVGLVTIWVVLEPMAVITSILGFFKGSRYKGLAAAGFVIAVIAFIIQLFQALYNGNIIGRWAIEGVLN